MIRQLLTIWLLAFALCCSLTKSAALRSSQQSENLVGAWDLKSVGGADPSSINIRTYKVVFEEGGTWRYEATMSGQYEGMQLKGSGSWSVKGDKLQYTAGANKGETSIRISRNSLTLSPDPVLRPKGTDVVEATYARSGAQK